MAAKHTPGPWQWDGQSRVDALQFRTLSPFKLKDEDGVERDYMDGMVALPYSCGAPETREANALLIAAAPDMFQTLNDMDGWLANTGHAPDHPWRLSLRAAIDKAVGGAPGNERYSHSEDHQRAALDAPGAPYV